MKQACVGNSVKVHYKGTFDDGTVFDSSLDCDPLEFTIGGGQVIPGFENAVIGMSVGETKTSRITSDDAYGPHIEEMVVSFDRDQLPADLQPSIGQVLRFRRNDGQIIEVTVTDLSDTSVTFDGNHPLAGKDLNFEIQLLEIN
ncbi:MAG TPA: peptidylprolyl isomerase [Syntrophales bacterium]|nr:peptidylprolyl isomerase [Syntrophales bacterium]